VPPDTGAATNWLENRVSNKWRDKVDHQHSGEVMQITMIETIIIDPKTPYSDAGRRPVTPGQRRRGSAKTLGSGSALLPVNPGMARLAVDNKELSSKSSPFSRVPLYRGGRF
jgi:hypothetical protein